MLTAEGGVVVSLLFGPVDGDQPVRQSVRASNQRGASSASKKRAYPPRITFPRESSRGLKFTPREFVSAALLSLARGGEGEFAEDPIEGPSSGGFWRRRYFWSVGEVCFFGTYLKKRKNFFQYVVECFFFRK